jgi:hypothetical protein
MVAELSALQQIMNALTGMDGLPMVIVECMWCQSNFERPENVC